MNSPIYDKVSNASPVNKDGPHAWIQWKGTDVCADIRCRCGELAHLDGSFTYSVRCGGCGTLYGMDPHVTLVPLEEKDVEGACDPHWACIADMGEPNGCKCPSCGGGA